MIMFCVVIPDTNFLQIFDLERKVSDPGSIAPQYGRGTDG